MFCHSPHGRLLRPTIVDLESTPSEALEALRFFCALTVLLLIWSVAWSRLHAFLRPRPQPREVFNDFKEPHIARML